MIDGDPRITLLDRTLDRSELDALIAGCDALMLLHRSEGFGLPLAEAMGQGLPVVATNWSGNTDFMDFDNSCPVSYCLVPARDPQGSYDHADQLWAEPSAETPPCTCGGSAKIPPLGRNWVRRRASRSGSAVRRMPLPIASGALLMADAALC